MLELYHSINSVCAQKIRLALNEKKLPCSEHLMKLNGDQFDPAYLKLNPNGVVPTLDHNGKIVTDSSVIIDRRGQRRWKRPAVDQRCHRCGDGGR